MSRFPSTVPVLASACMALACCAPPKATVVEEPKPKAASKTVEKPSESTSEPIVKPAHGLRMGNMLQLPKDSELRPTSAVSTGGDAGGGAVVASPMPKPSEPPKTTPKE